MIKLKSELAVGVFVVVGFILLTLVVFGVSGIYLFRPGYYLKADFDYVGIIDRGAPVRYAGVKIGEVKKVDINESADGVEHGHVRLTLFIVKGVQIYENDRISVQGTHIMAEPHVEIEPAETERGRMLKDGDQVDGGSPISMDDLILQGQEIADKINSFLAGIEESFKDPKSKEALSGALLNLSELTASMNTILKGQEQEARAGLSNLNKSADQLSILLEKMNQGQGTMGRLMSDDELYKELLELVRDIKKHPWRLLKKG